MRTKEADMKKMTMKRKALPVLMILALSGFAAAQEADDQGIGLKTGLGFNFGNLRVLDESVITIIPQAQFDNTFGPVDLYLELDYSVSIQDIFYPEEGDDNLFDNLPQKLYLEQEFAYNFSPWPAALFTPALNNQTRIIITPNPGSIANRAAGTADPHITFAHDVGVHEIYWTAGLPIAYANFDQNFEPALSVYLTMGWEFTSGLGFEVTGKRELRPEPVFGGMKGLLYFGGSRRFYFELGYETGRDFGAFTLTPVFEGYYKHFIFRAEAAFGRPGRDQQIFISPTVWLKRVF
jgi:hypothetical protein